MLALPPSVAIWFYAAPTDMRNSFDGLTGLVLGCGLEATSGDLFVFVNRARDRMKILGFEGDGLALWYKRLEAGRFEWPGQAGNGAAAGTSVLINAQQLRLILDGIDLQSVKRRKRYHGPGPGLGAEKQAKSCGKPV